MKNELINRFYYKKDRLNQIRGFCAVVQNGCSATKASKVLHLEPATIGQQIKSLETEFGTEFFDRKYTNKLVITDAGIKFYKMSIPIIDGIDNMFLNFKKELDYERQNVLNIASLDIIIVRLIPFFIKMKQENTDLEINTFNIPKERAFEMLDNRELDIAIYPCNINEELLDGLYRQKITEYKEYWILYKGHSYEKLKDIEITKEMMAKYPFAILEDLIYIESFQNFIDEYNIKSPIHFRYGTTDMIKNMVKNKSCVSLLNGLYLTEQDKKELIYKSTHVNFPLMNYYYFVKNNSIKFKKPVELFLKFLSDSSIDNVFS